MPSSPKAVRRTLRTSIFGKHGSIMLGRGNKASSRTRTTLLHAVQQSKAEAAQLLKSDSHIWRDTLSIICVAWIAFVVPFRASFLYDPFNEYEEDRSSYILIIVVNALVDINWLYRYAQRFRHHRWYRRIRAAVRGTSISAKSIRRGTKPALAPAHLLADITKMNSEMHGWKFIVDTFACIPMELLVVIPGIPEYSFDLLRLNRCGRLLFLGRYLADYASSNGEKLGSGIFRHMLNNSGVARLTRLFGFMLACSHWCACAFMLCATANCGYGLKHCSMDGGSSWAGEDMLMDAVVLRRYWRAMYWAVVTLVTVGYGDITPTNALETVVTGMIELLGACLSAHVIASYAFMFDTLNTRMANFSMMVDNASEYMSSRLLPRSLRACVRSYFDFLWSAQEGVDERMVTAGLPQHLQETCLNHLLSENVRRVPFLRSAPVGVTNAVAKALEQRIFIPGDFIISWSWVEEMFLVSRGRVAVIIYHPSSRSERILTTLEPGDSFAGLAMFKDGAVQEKFAAETYCEVYALTRAKFTAVMKQFYASRTEVKMKAMAEEAERNLKQGEKTKKLLGQGTLREFRGHGQSGADVAWNLPGSWFRRVWDAVSIVLVLYLALVVPYRVVFTVPKSYPDLLSNLGSDPVNEFMFFIDMCVDIFFITDLWLNARRFAFVDVELTGMTEAIVQPDKIFDRYRASGNFYSDVVASLPLDMVLGLLMDSSTTPALRLTRLLRLTRMVHLPRVLENTFKAMNVNSSIEKLVYIFINVLLLVHWVGCIWYFVPDMAHSSAGVMSGGVDMQACLAVNNDASSNPCTWIVYDGTLGRDSLFRFVRSFYWSVIGLTTVGYGDIRPFTTAETVIGFMWILFGGFINYGVVGAISYSLTQMRVRRTTYQDRVETINSYLNHQGVCPNICSSIRSYYSYQWARQKGVDEGQILSALPGALQEQITDFLNKDICASIPVFDGCNKDFLKSITSKFRQQVYQPNDYIVREGDVTDSMFIVNHGRVEVLSANRDVCLKGLDADGFFGDAQFLDNTRRTSWVRTRTFCDISILYRRDFDPIAEKYSEDLAKMKKNAKVQKRYYRKLNHAMDQNRSCGKIRQIIDDHKQVYVSLKDPKGVFRTTSVPRTLWKVLLAVVILYNLIVIPLRVAFLYGENYTKEPDGGLVLPRHRISLDPTFNLVLTLVDGLADATLLLDIYLHLFHFALEVHGEDIVDPRRFRARYVATRLKWDLLASLPLYLWWVHPNTMSLLRLPRLFRTDQLPSLIRQFQTRLQNAGSSSKATLYLRLLTVFLTLSAVSHLFGCVFYLLAAVNDDYESTWAGQDAVIASASADGHAFGTKYVRSFYWAISTLTVVCYGDVVPRSESETVFCSLVALVGFFAIGQVIGEMTTVMANLDQAAAAQEKKVDHFSQYALKQELPQQLRERVHQFFDFQLKHTRGLDESAIFDELPDSLRIQVAMFLFRPVLDVQPVFEGLEPGRRNAIAMRLRSQLYLPNDTVITQGDMGLELLLVRSGRAEVITKAVGFVFATISPGCCVGEVAFLLPVRRMASVRAVSTCEFMSLQREDWDACVDPAHNEKCKLYAEEMRVKYLQSHAAITKALSFMRLKVSKHRRRVDRDEDDSSGTSVGSILYSRRTSRKSSVFPLSRKFSKLSLNMDGEAEERYHRVKESKVRRLLLTDPSKGRGRQRRKSSLTHGSVILHDPKHHGDQWNRHVNNLNVLNRLSYATSQAQKLQEAKQSMALVVGGGGEDSESGAGGLIPVPRGLKGQQSQEGKGGGKVYVDTGVQQETPPPPAPMVVRTKIVSRRQSKPKRSSGRSVRDGVAAAITMGLTSSSPAGGYMHERGGEEEDEAKMQASLYRSIYTPRKASVAGRDHRGTQKLDGAALEALTRTDPGTNRVDGRRKTATVVPSGTGNNGASPRKASLKEDMVSVIRRFSNLRIMNMAGLSGPAGTNSNDSVLNENKASQEDKRDSESSEEEDSESSSEGEDSDDIFSRERDNDLSSMVVFGGDPMSEFGRPHAVLDGSAPITGIGSLPMFTNLRYHRNYADGGNVRRTSRGGLVIDGGLLKRQAKSQDRAQAQAQGEEARVDHMSVATEASLTPTVDALVDQTEGDLMDHQTNALRIAQRSRVSIRGLNHGSKDDTYLQEAAVLDAVATASDPVHLAQQIGKLEETLAANAENSESTGRGGGFLSDRTATFNSVSAEVTVAEANVAMSRLERCIQIADERVAAVTAARAAEVGANPPVQSRRNTSSRRTSHHAGSSRRGPSSRRVSKRMSSRRGSVSPRDIVSDAESRHDSEATNAIGSLEGDTLRRGSSNTDGVGEDRDKTEVVYDVVSAVDPGQGLVDSRNSSGSVSPKSKSWRSNPNGSSMLLHSESGLGLAPVSEHHERKRSHGDADTSTGAESDRNRIDPYGGGDGAGGEGEGKEEEATSGEENPNSTGRTSPKGTPPPKHLPRASFNKMLRRRTVGIELNSSISKLQSRQQGGVRGPNSPALPPGVTPYVRAGSGIGPKHVLRSESLRVVISGEKRDAAAYDPRVVDPLLNGNAAPKDIQPSPDLPANLAQRIVKRGSLGSSTTSNEPTTPTSGSRRPRSSLSVVLSRLSKQGNTGSVTMAETGGGTGRVTSRRAGGFGSVVYNREIQVPGRLSSSFAPEREESDGGSSTSSGGSSVSGSIRAKTRRRKILDPADKTSPPPASKGSRRSVVEVSQPTRAVLGVWVVTKPPPESSLPSSHNRTMWEVVMLLLLLYYSVSIPFRIAFSSRSPTTSLDWTSFVFDYTTDVLLLIDMGLNHTWFCYLSGGELVSDRRRITSNYIHNWFAYDLVAGVPLELVALLPVRFSLPKWELLALLRVNKLVRLAHLPALLSSLQLYIQLQGVQIKGGTIRFLKMLLFFLLVAHWVACVWYLVGYESLQMRGVDTAWITSGTLHHFKDHTDAPLELVYLRAVYYAITSLSTVGYGDIVCTNEVETVLQLLVCVMSTSMMGALVGAAEMSIRSVDEDRANHEQRSNDTAKFLDYRKFPPDVRERIMLYFKDLWVRQKGVDESKVLSLLPSMLQQDVALFVKHALLKVSLFSTCDPSFAKAVVRVMRPELFMPGDLVVRQGERGRTLYLVHEGTVCVYDNKKSFKVIKEKGEFFGELSLLYAVPRIANVEVVTMCDIYLLHAEDYEKVLRLYPEYREKNRRDWVMANHKLVSRNPKLARKIQFVSRHTLTRQQEEKIWGMYAVE